ncbi:hypothetical protein [Peterkaempfera griseoplana]|uniref:hypothetical protein n=1 Tax=Peterkaempfera griseoplana TaxID=66896 RepID=UPI0006E2C7A7|nr:hypothetical protein [Peterkaempfera griseoplana]
MTRTLALVESPVQLLNALEWAHRYAQGPDRGEGAPLPGAPAEHPADVPGDDPRTAGAAAIPAQRGGAAAPSARLSIAVLQPQDPVTRAQLAALAELATAEGIRVAVYDPRGGPRGRARSLAALAPRVALAPRLLIGDAFSGLIQALLPLSRADQLVVVDDGTATVELVDLLESGRPLVRWHRGGKGSASAARAARRLASLPPRRLELFTSLPVGPPSGALGTANLYSWTRARFGPPRVLPGADLLGSSLVETGIVTPERYLRTVSQLAADHGVRRYFAHRREHPEKLTRIAAATGAEIVRPRFPLEIEARRGPVSATLLSFPSTVVHTLPLVLDGTGVRVKICAVDADWLTPGASARSLSFLTDVSTSARSRHGLEMISPVTA